MNIDIPDFTTVDVESTIRYLFAQAENKEISWIALHAVLWTLFIVAPQPVDAEIEKLRCEAQRRHSEYIKSIGTKPH